MWGKVGISITDNLSKIIDDSEVVIEFTMPKSTIENLRIASIRKIPFVIGTTGFSNDELEEVKGLTKTIPCVMAPNMSVGVNLVFKTIADIAKILGDDYDIEIVEAHHRFKKDAPSGTAIKMAEVIAEALNRNLNEVGIYARHGIIGERKKEGDRHTDCACWRYCRRAYSHLRRNGRAHRGYAPRAYKGQFCKGRNPRCKVGGKAEARAL